tara:strand:- start:1387 stop:1614 length:228 start_codon:yes stop_codon:yes gene_type:complete
MTSVNITTNKNTVTVDEDNSSVITVATQGPQGANAALINVDNAINKSVVYYDSASSSLKADATWTVSTLVFGGDF